MARAALVTGAARGIGRAIALGLAERGFDVAVHYRSSREDAQRTAREVRRRGRRSLLVQADLTDAEAAAGAVARAAQGLGGLAVLVHNVGDYLYKPIEEVTPAEWSGILDSNLSSAVYVAQAALPHLLAGGWGRIVFMGYAGAGQTVAKPHITPYFVAKTGVLLYAKALAARLAVYGVTVNVVAPGVAETSVTQPLREIPMGRAAYIEELVDAVGYFVGTSADYVTGQVLEVAGGWNL
ncbi:MAG TPA: bifunctional dihydropteridine reductase/dihydrofolate reductase TmpR [Oceanithermus profundus]|uniref:Bifunctional dihydropteridine reductase/dihydrofolate reductase TmpR n=1 Tax=Oceanithermus profundus TaxID=187137 RepID=A0A7C4V500_9DEIN|nr:bifunctional dihydropteridine reductase/dihydrofolate reductase TmpR [Oceanithermus profundus]